MTNNIKRRIVQFFSAIALNWYLFLPTLGFYSRSVCAPALNCWTCPAAAFACPIGVLGTSMANHVFPYLALGILLFLGALAGRFWCGWVCPFGTLQDILFKIPSYKLNIPNYLSYTRFLFLFGGVILVPLITSDTASSLFWCQYCPAGRIEAGIYAKFVTPIWPQTWRLIVLIGFVSFMIMSLRGFCRVFCPLGAIFGIFNKISFWKIHYKEHKCLSCNKCHDVCPINNKVTETPDSANCIRCLECQKSCKTGAVWHGPWFPWSD